MSTKGNTMKRYLLTLLVLGSLSPLAAMRGSRPTPAKKAVPKGAAVSKTAPAKPAPKKIEGTKDDTAKSKTTIIDNYVDMGDLLLSFGRLYKDGETDTGSMCIASLKALKIEKLPLSLTSGREATLGEFFEPKFLKKSIKKFLKKWFAGELKKHYVAEVLTLLKKSLKMDAITSEFGEREWIDLDKSLDKLIAYYDGDETGDIEEAIDLEKLPAFFGFVLRDYFLIDKLNTALNDALKGEALTKSVLLDCVDIEQIALRRGYEEVPNADGIRESIELFLAMMEDDKTTMFQIFDILGVYRQTKNAVEEDEPKPPVARKKDAALLKQEADDAALAKQLAEQWNKK